MKINSIINRPHFVSFLENELQDINGEVYLFLAEACFDSESKESDFRGLSVAIEIYKGDIPLLLCSSYPLSFFENDERYLILKKRGKVGFLKFPFGIPELIIEYKNLIPNILIPNLN